MTRFRDEDELERLNEDGDVTLACPKCKTDGFLMDAPFQGAL